LFRNLFITTSGFSVFTGFSGCSSFGVVFSGASAGVSSETDAGFKALLFMETPAFISW